MSDDVRDNRLRRILIGLFILIGVLIASDLATDYRNGVDARHLVVESVILLLAGLGVVFLGRRFATTRAALAQAEEDALHWRAQNEELLRGLGAAIEQQFIRWQLTPAESDVALMLLKGYSHKEIAVFRSASERTIREQARAVYRKAGLGGRAALSAFFLEDLLLPHERSDD